MMQCPAGVRNSVFVNLPEDIQLELMRDLETDSVEDIPVEEDDLANYPNDTNNPDSRGNICHPDEIARRSSSLTSKISRRVSATRETVTAIPSLLRSRETPMVGGVVDAVPQESPRVRISDSTVPEKIPEEGEEYDEVSAPISEAARAHQAHMNEPKTDTKSSSSIYRPFRFKNVKKKLTQKSNESATPPPLAPVSLPPPPSQALPPPPPPPPPPPSSNHLNHSHSNFEGHNSAHSMLSDTSYCSMMSEVSAKVQRPHRYTDDVPPSTTNYSSRSNNTSTSSNISDISSRSVGNLPTSNRNIPQQIEQQRSARPGFKANNYSSNATSPSGRAAFKYKGEKNSSGQFHGKGKLKMDNGSIYDGHFMNGRRHGIGAMAKMDGTTYNGGWKDDRYHGHGIYKCTDGYMYRGHYQQGKQHGHGECHFPNGDEYVGEWVHGDMEGAGVYRHINGDTFEGFFQKGQRHGPGGYQRAKDGKLDIVCYEYGVRTGEGVRFDKKRKKARKLVGGEKCEKLSLVKAESIAMEVCRGLTFGQLLTQMRERHREVSRGVKWKY